MGADGVVRHPCLQSATRFAAPETYEACEGGTFIDHITLAKRPYLRVWSLERSIADPKQPFLDSRYWRTHSADRTANRYS